MGGGKGIKPSKFSQFWGNCGTHLPSTLPARRTWNLAFPSRKSKSDSLPRAGTLSTTPSFSKLHPTRPWTFPGNSTWNPSWSRIYFKTGSNKWRFQALTPFWDRRIFLGQGCLSDSFKICIFGFITTFPWRSHPRTLIPCWILALGTAEFSHPRLETSQIICW